MALLKNLDTNDEITQFVSLKQNQEVIRIIHKTLDGSQHIQRFGEPTKAYELSIFVCETGRQKLLTAEDTCALLEVAIKNGVFLGRIIDISDFEKLPAGYFKATATLSCEVVD